MEYFHVPNQFPDIGLVFLSLSALLALLPMWLVFYSIWKPIVQSAGKRKWIYIFRLLPPIAALPMFVLMVDWGRNFGAIVICLFTTLFSLYRMGDKYVKSSFEAFERQIKQSNFYYLIVLVYLSIIGRFTAAGVIDGVARLPYDLLMHLAHEMNLTIQDIFPWFRQQYWSGT